MRVWHICPEKVLDAIVERGYYRADGRYVWQHFRPAYKWLVSQMDLRLPEKRDPRIRYPVWVWVNYSEKNARPDLRRSAHLAPGTPGVRLELEIPEERILQSDFSFWHCVLNNAYCSWTEKEYDELGEPIPAFFNGRTPEQQQVVESTWPRVFDLTTPRDIDWHGEKYPTQIQGTLWQFDLSEVVGYTKFVAR